MIKIARDQQERVPVVECRYGTRNGQYALKIERFFAEEDAKA
jgi:flagellar motor switch protein FliM